MSKELSWIQSQLKAPKAQYNAFGKYKYRTCEDILEALKPILSQVNMSVVLSDEIANIGNRFYVRSDVELIGPDGTVIIGSTAYAREAENKKGMDEAQVTGAASSYARKFALAGLFAIDDNEDLDSQNHDAPPKPQQVSYDIKEFGGKEPEKAKDTPDPAIKDREKVEPRPDLGVKQGISGTVTDPVEGLLDSFEGKIEESVDTSTQDGRLYHLADIEDEDLLVFAQFANAKIGNYEGSAPVSAATLDAYILRAKTNGSLEDRKKRAVKKQSLDRMWNQYVAGLVKK